MDDKVYTITITRKSQWYNPYGRVEVLVNSMPVGILYAGETRTFQVTKSELQLQARSFDRKSLIRFTSTPLTITPERAEIFQYQVAFGITNLMFGVLIMFILTGIVLFRILHQMQYLLLFIVPFTFIPYHVFIRKDYVLIEELRKIQI